MLNRIIRFFLDNKLFAVLLLVAMILWGIVVAPFSWESEWFPRDPTPVDAIPDLGENQQIVLTEWKGRSPRDIQDQVTYPLTAALTGVSGVKTIRSSSMFGASIVYVIFEEGIDFYWGRSRIIEKLKSLPPNTLPNDVQPSLGPEATALGQIFWYTLEGRDANGNPAGGWDPQELRTIQDYTVKYALASADGVAEVASVGGFVKEFQVDIDPVAMEAHKVTLGQIIQTVANSNLDVGAKTIEINKVEYFVRGLGYVEDLEDLEEAVVKHTEDVPIRIRDIARVTFGPAPRRGALDKGGVEAVGGVVVASYGSNPMETILNVKEQIERIAPGLPEKTLEDGTVSKVTIVPFYDRTALIKETLGTLEEALTLEILITIIVIILMVLNLRVSLLISGMLPVAVLMCFIAMKQFGVDANIVALSGIAIAIGTMVDMGIILSENIVRHIDEHKKAGSSKNTLEVVYEATTEVASAVVTAVATTIISFLPVFTMVAAEGKLFRPLAFTKTFALLASIILAITVLPAFAHWLLGFKMKRNRTLKILNILVVVAGFIVIFWSIWGGLVLLGTGIFGFLANNEKVHGFFGAGVMPWITTILVGLFVSYILATNWVPLGPERSAFANFMFTSIIIGSLIILFYLIIHYYSRILRWCLGHKWLFLLIPCLLLSFGLFAWLGASGVFGWSKEEVKASGSKQRAAKIFPGTKDEFMPSLDEGAFLLMPTSMPHSGVEENMENLQMLDRAVEAIPEVSTVVGKLGRVNSALDPAPISMYENVINYKSEYKTDENGVPIRFKADNNGEFIRDSTGNLIPDKNGHYFRQWRDHIKSPDDIWKEIDKIRIPGVTPAPKLQPIETRLTMLQTGMRSPMGIKVYGPNLDTIEEFGFELEQLLQRVEGVKPGSVLADRIIGKPYLEIDLNPKGLSRYGLKVVEVQNYIQTAIGGVPLSQAVKGRERFPIRLRYAREYRDNPTAIAELLIPTHNGNYVELGEIADVNYEQGPQMIKSENTFLVGYVLFDRADGYGEIEVVENAIDSIDKAIQSGELRVPGGVSYEFAGTYENQVRANKRMSVVLPISLAFVFLILFLQFRSFITTTMIFTAIAVAFSGGFIMMWLYGQEWFMDFSFFGTNLRELFGMGEVSLSTAVWVGFIALFGIATDDGVVVATYLKQTFEKNKPTTRKAVRDAVVEAGSRRIRPCLMTTATTLLALLPVLSSTGRGSDIMIPMAIPSFGGMAIELITLFIIPVLYSMWQERRMTKSIKNER